MTSNMDVNNSVVDLEEQVIKLTKTDFGTGSWGYRFISKLF